MFRVRVTVCPASGQLAVPSVTEVAAVWKLIWGLTGEQPNEDNKLTRLPPDAKIACARVFCPLVNMMVQASVV